MFQQNYVFLLNGENNIVELLRGFFRLKDNILVKFKFIKINSLIIIEILIILTEIKELKSTNNLFFVLTHYFQMALKIDRHNLIKIFVLKH